MTVRAPRRAAAEESGFVIAIVLVLMLIGLLVVTAALAGAVSSSNAAGRDARAKRALAAADAGIQAQLYASGQTDLGSSAYNFNGGVIGLSSFLDCTVPKLNPSLQITGVVNTYASSAGVCPQAWSSATNSSTPLNQSLGAHTTYTSEMITGQTNVLNGTTISGQNGSAQRELLPKIVSIGSETTNTPAGSATVYSREEAILAPVAPLQAIEGTRDVTIGGLTLLGLPVASTLNGDVTAGRDLTLPSVAFAGLNLSNGLLATLTYGRTLSGGAAIANIKFSSSFITRPPVSIAASKPNCSVAANCTALGAAYNSSYDTFSMSSGSVTFAPGDYVFCSFNATGGTITASPTSATSGAVRIFIDNPNSTRCAGDTPPARPGGDPNIGNFNDPAGFNNSIVSGALGALAASGVQIYVVGDGVSPYDSATKVQIGPTSTSGLLSLSALTYAAIVYAPTSKVTVNVPGLCVITCSLVSSGGVFEGAVIGNDTTVNALLITQDLSIGNYPLYAGINAFRVTQYLQCDNSVTSLAGTTADLNGC